MQSTNGTSWLRPYTQGSVCVQLPGSDRGRVPAVPDRLCKKRSLSSKTSWSGDTGLEKCRGATSCRRCRPNSGHRPQPATAKSRSAPLRRSPVGRWSGHTSDGPARPSARLRCGDHARAMNNRAAHFRCRRHALPHRTSGIELPVLDFDLDAHSRPEALGGTERVSWSTPAPEHRPGPVESPEEWPLTVAARLD